MRYSSDIKVNAVDEYLSTSATIGDIAKKFNIHRNTLGRWVKLYQEGGRENLINKQVKHKVWNRTPSDIEFRVILLKEKCPELTISKIQKQLKEQGIHLSRNGVFIILRRFGLIRKTESFIPKLNSIEKSKDMLSIHNRGLKKKFNNYILLRNKLEEINSLIGRVSYNEVFQKARRLRFRLEKNGFFYSAVRCAFIEMTVLEWLDSDQSLSLIHYLEKILSKKYDTALRTKFLFHKGVAYSRILDYKEVLLCAREIKRAFYNRKILRPLDWHHLAALYSFLNDYRKSVACLDKGIRVCQKSDKVSQFLLSSAKAHGLAFHGRYRESLDLVNNLQLDDRGYQCMNALTKARCFMGEGRLNDAKAEALIALEKAEKDKISIYIYNSSLILSSIYAAIGDTKRAYRFLECIIPMLEKNKMVMEVAICKTFLEENFMPAQKIIDFPIAKVVYLLKMAEQTGRISYYDKALHLARKYGILEVLHRHLLFSPGVVKKIFEKRVPREIPRNYLKLPIFQKEKFVFRFDFLGSFKVYRNNKRWLVKLTPLEEAFLIHLSQARINELDIDTIYQNYWPQSINPSHCLIQLLWRLRRKLLIPTYLLRIKRFSGKKLLINQGVVFVTDYKEFGQSLAQAKALLRAGEWGFAKKEYLRAFRVFRGEPFKKMYDPWSENMRRVILNKLETEAVHFAKRCLAHSDKQTAKKILKKALKIIPESQEIVELSRKLQ